MAKFEKFSFGPKFLNDSNFDVKMLAVHFENTNPFWVEFSTVNELNHNDVVEILQKLASEIQKRFQ